MAGNKKYRNELKFILSPIWAEILKHRLSFVMDIDENATNKDNTYLVRSLYFDDFENSAYYDKITGEKSRYKYRIRIYNLDHGVIKLERKEKERNLIHKKAMTISEDVYNEIVSGNINLELTKNDDLLAEFIRDMETKDLRPSVIVNYKRLAYTYPAEDTRVTFDEGVASGRFDYNLFSKDILLYDILNSNETIIEVKFNNGIPSHIASILNSIPTIRQAVSKYTICYEKKEAVINELFRYN